jgi:hypothetical protein
MTAIPDAFLAFLARRARKAYATEAEVRAALAAQGAETAGWYEHKTCEAFLARYDRLAVMSFRGTEPTKEPADLLVDLDATRAPMVADGVTELVHRGFWHNLAPLVSRISKDVQGLRGDGLEVYVTGHSKGGAEAVLYCLWEALHSRSPGSALVTFGAPRCLSPSAAEAMRILAHAPRHIRVVHRCDAVPLVPPILGGYRHDCDATWLDGEGGLWPTVHPAWEAARRAVNLRPGRSVRDHSIDRYIAALDKAAAHG